MASFSLWVTFGLCLLKLCLTETEFNVSCRYGGVFHVEKNGRYSLTWSEAVNLCRALNSTLATLEQLKRAHELGFETCRYGFVVGHIVIPRITPHHLCAANKTGIYKLSANSTDQFDAYCYNATETKEKTCEPVEKIDTSLLNNHDETVIDNADGSRYNADGTRHTGGESSTSGLDEENAGSGSTHETTPMDTSIRRSSPSYYGSPTPVSQMPDHTSGGGYELAPVSPDVPLGTEAYFHEEHDGQSPASTTVDSQHETLLEITTQDHWNPAFTDEEEHYPSTASRVLVTSENEKRQGPTQHPLIHSAHSGGITQERNPVNTTGSNEQHEFTIADENYFGKETSPTAVVPSHGARQNDSVQDPLVYPGWDKGEDDATQPAVTERVIPSRETNREGQSSTTAVASPGGAHHKDPTQPPLPSDDESEKSTEGILNPTDAPWGEVLHRTTATVTKTVTASTAVLAPEDMTQEVWAPHLVTAVSSPDGGHHKETTQPPLPSDDEPGQGTEGIINPTDGPRDEILHRTTATVTKTVVESVDDAEQEEATKEPLAPVTAPGREDEQANATDGSHIHEIPGDFSDIEDHFLPFQTPLPTSSTSSVDGDQGIDDSQGPDKGQDESTASPGETTTTTIETQPRSAHVPDWLIIVAALVALALILGVCIAVNSRRRCGQKKKLVINNGKGAVEDRKTSELNGDVSKSQEMVHLVHKEQSNDRTQACDTFLTVNETQNHHELDMKTGV